MHSKTAKVEKYGLWPFFQVEKAMAELPKESIDRQKVKSSRTQLDIRTLESNTYEGMYADIYFKNNELIYDISLCNICSYRFSIFTVQYMQLQIFNISLYNISSCKFSKSTDRYVTKMDKFLQIKAAIVIFIHDKKPLYILK